MQTIGGHQLDFIAFAGADHFPAIPLRQRQRFLTKNVNTSLGGTDGKVAMQGIRQANVNGINRSRFKKSVQFLVNANRWNAVTAGEFPLFHGVVRKKGHEPGIPTGMSKGRQHGCLRNVPQTDHGIADKAGRFGIGLIGGGRLMAQASGSSPLMVREAR